MSYKFREDGVALAKAILFEQARERPLKVNLDQLGPEFFRVISLQSTIPFNISFSFLRRQRCSRYLASNMQTRVAHFVLFGKHFIFHKINTPMKIIQMQYDRKKKSLSFCSHGSLTCVRSGAFSLIIRYCYTPN